MLRSHPSLIPAILSCLLAACGGSSSPSGTAGDIGGEPLPAAATTGKVTVLLTDARGHDWDQALATITSIELLGEDRSELIFEGSTTVDLLSLPDYYDVFSVADEIEPGRFEKIRLLVESLELVDFDDDGDEVERIMAQLVGGGKIDLDPRGDIVIGPGDVLYIEIDFDMHKAFKTTTTGNGRVIVRPVVRVNVTTEPPVGRLTRMRGTIGDIDAEDLEFELCQEQLVSEMDDDGDDDSDDGDMDSEHSQCIDVTTDAATGIFGPDGTPIEFSGLVPGDTVTAIGHLRRELYDDDDDDGDDDDDDDDGDDDDEDDDDGGDDDDDDGGGDDKADGGEQDDKHGGDGGREVVLHAVTIEKGDDFLRVSGVVDGAVTGDVFDLAIEPGQGLGTDDEVLSTRLYAATRIFHKNGDELDQSAIEPGVGVIADGVLVPAEDMADTLRAALLILDPEFDVAGEVLRGEILSIDFDAGTLQLATDEAEHCVNALAADIYLISNVDGLVTERVGLGDLEPMQRADVFGDGTNDLGCFLASDILASALPNTLPVADAGEDATITAGESVMLDGSASSDEDNDPLTYQWTFTSIPDGSTAEIAGADGAMPSFIADLPGDYVVELVVNDGAEDSAPDTVTITATAE